jgi:periplasmic mercuric ion binding protein
MKQLIKTGFLTVLAILLLSMIATAQEKKTTDTVKIKTSAICQTCKQKIEHDLSFTKGVKKVTLDLPSQIVTVEFDARKTDPDGIKKAITLIGYDADELVADGKAYKKLPACCKKENAPH